MSAIVVRPVEQKIVVRPVSQKIIVRRPGPPGASELALLTDVDTAGAASGDLLGLLVSGKWGPVTNVSDLLQADHGPAGGVLAGTYPNPDFAPSPIFAPSSAGAVGMLVVGLTGQTGDYFQAKNSLGSTVAQVTALGEVRATRFSSVATGKATLESNYDTGALVVLTGADSNKGLVIRRNSGAQTGTSMFEVQTESGAAVASILGTGGVYGQYFETQGQTANYMLYRGGTPNNSLVAANSTHVVMVIKAAAGQSTDLQQWQDSTGAVAAKVSQAGYLQSPRLYSLSGNIHANLNMGLDTGGVVISTNADANKGLVIKRNSATQSASLQEWQDETQTIRLRVNASGVLNSNQAGHTFGQSTGITATLSAVATAATIIPLIARGFVSQSANLQEWQDSAGVVKAQLEAAGGLRATAFTSVTTGKAVLSPNADTGGMLLTTAADANKGLVVRRNSATQSGNLQEWQDESGVILARVFPSGAIHSTGSISIASAQMASAATTAATIGLVLRGAVSQSANIQEWQDSTGAIKSRINSGGAIISSNSNSPNILASPTSAGAVGLQIKGAFSQTGDLVQLMDTNSSVLSRITAAGAIQSYGVTQTFDNLAVPTGVAAALNATASTLVAGTPYFYVVTATNAAGETVASTEVTATPTAPNPSIAVSWSLVLGATGYKVYRSTVSGTYTTPALVATIANAQTLSFTDSGTALGAGSPPTSPAGTKLVVRGWASAAPINVLEVQNAASSAVVAVNQFGGAAFGQSTILGRVTAYTGSASTVGIIVRGVASQSANLQEWQDSTGVAQAQVSPSGVVQGTAFASATAGKAWLFPNGDTGGFRLDTRADANKGLVIRRNSATQSANMFEIQKEDGTILTSINAGFGHIFAPGAAFTAPNSSYVPVVVKGAVSQSGDLQQWQSSAAAVLAKVTSTGTVYGTSVRTITDKFIAVEENSGGAALLSKQTAQAGTPGGSLVKMYVRDGTNAGTLKLVALGPGGVEVTIVDNIA